MSGFPALSGWRETRESLHLYCRLLGAVRSHLVAPHPLWWHASLKVETAGPGTGVLAVPDDAGPPFALTLDLERHVLGVEAGSDERVLADLRQAPTGKALGEAVLAALAGLGLPLQVERSRWEDDRERAYTADEAAAYRQALVSSARLLETFRAALPGDSGPVQLWPHHFDLSFECFSGRTQRQEGNGDIGQSRSQIGFGFSPGDDHHPEAYYYATPWPFDEALLAVELPAGARWLTEPWKGALLPYAALTASGGTELNRFFKTVYSAAAPTLRG